MTDHPNRAALAALCRQDLTPEREGQVVHHLLFQRCPQCLAGVAQEAGRKLSRRLKALPLMTVRLAQSWQLRHDDPQEMVKLAWAASTLSSRLDRGIYGMKEVCDYQAAAQAELGNAYRAAERTGDAERALAEARRLFERGTHDENLEVRLLELEATYFALLRQFGPAVHKLLPVLEFYDRREDSHNIGRTLVLMGLYRGYGGDYEHGIRRLEQSLQLIDAKRDPRTAYCAAHNLILFLVDCGRVQEARKLRMVHSRYLLDSGGRVHQLKFRNLEGRIATGLGQLAGAEGIFREVLEGFTNLGLAIVAGIAALDLAAVLLQQGKPATGIILEATEAFVLHRVRREALAAMILLRDSFKQGSGTLEMVLEVAAFLRQFDIDPSVSFEGRAWELPKEPEE